MAVIYYPDLGAWLKQNEIRRTALLATQPFLSDRNWIVQLELMSTLTRGFHTTHFLTSSKHRMTLKL